MLKCGPAERGALCLRWRDRVRWARHEPEEVSRVGGGLASGRSAARGRGLRRRQEGGGPVGITFTFGPDASGSLQGLIDRFNKEHKGEIKVTWRTTAAASDDYFEQIKTELQAGKATVDVIGGT